MRAGGPRPSATARGRVIAAGIGQIVELVRRNAAAVVIAMLLLSVGSGFYAATHLAINTDIANMLPKDVAWRQNEVALDQAFPQNDSLQVGVVDGETGILFDHAARQPDDRNCGEHG